MGSKSGRGSPRACTVARPLRVAEMITSLTLAHFLFVVVCGIWGASFLCMKKAGLVFTDLDIAATRVTLACMTLAILWAIRRTSWPFRRADVAPMLFLVGIGYIFPYLAQPYVIRHATSGFVATLVSLVPLITVIVSVPMLGVRPTKRQLFGVLGGLLCMIALCADKFDVVNNVVALIVGPIVPFVYAVANTYVRRRWSRTSPLALSFAATGLSAVLLLPLSVMDRPPHYDQGTVVAVGALALLGVFGTGVSIAIFYWLIRDRGPLYASMVAYVVPCVAMMLGWLDAERASPVHLLALGGILVMVYLVQSDRARDGRERV